MKRNIIFLLGMFLIMMACGGDEDPMTETCDTTDMTYTDDISTIMNATCALSGCHVDGAEFPGLFSYEKAKEYLDDDTNILVQSINHEEGVSPMPKNDAKLSDCNIDKIEAWIAAGAPE